MDGQNQEAAQACLVDEKTGKQLAHNFIELGVEYWLDRKYPDLKNELNRAFQNRKIIRRAADYISDCFGISQRKMDHSLQILGKLCAPRNLSGIRGIVNFWDEACQIFLGHGIDKEKAKDALKKATEIIKDDWEEFLDIAVSEIRKTDFQALP